MSAWSDCVASLWAAYWAAMLAQVARLRMCDDGDSAYAFAWTVAALLPTVAR